MSISDDSENPAKPDGQAANSPTDKLVAKIEREVGPVIPQSSRKLVLNKFSKILRQEFHFFKGPIPPPELFEGYEKVLPGSAHRILAMAEQSLAHDIAMNKKCQEDDNADRKLRVYPFLQQVRASLRKVA